MDRERKKVLILSNPGTAGFEIWRTPTKFLLMIEAIKPGGLEGTHYYVGTAGELKALLKKEHPDIVFSAAYYTQDKASDRWNVHGLLEAEGFPYIGSDETAFGACAIQSSAEGSVEGHRDPNARLFCCVRQQCMDD